MGSFAKYMVDNPENKGLTTTAEVEVQRVREPAADEAKVTQVSMCVLIESKVGGLFGTYALPK